MFCTWFIAWSALDWPYSGVVASWPAGPRDPTIRSIEGFFMPFTSDVIDFGRPSESRFGQRRRRGSDLRPVAPLLRASNEDRSAASVSPPMKRRSNWIPFPAPAPSHPRRHPRFRSLSVQGNCLMCCYIELSVNVNVGRRRAAWALAQTWTQLQTFWRAVATNAGRRARRPWKRREFAMILPDVSHQPVEPFAWKMTDWRSWKEHFPIQGSLNSCRKGVRAIVIILGILRRCFCQTGCGRDARELFRRSEEAVRQLPQRSAGKVGKGIVHDRSSVIGRETF